MSVNRIGIRSAVAVAIGVLAVAAGGVGGAVASSGGLFILGGHNSASSVTALTNRSGPALSLTAKHGKPALEVNTSTEVKHLNAALVGGSTASRLKTSGSAAATHFPRTEAASVANTPTVVALTAKLKPGTYYVTATAFLVVPPGEVGSCAVSSSDLSKAKDPLAGSVTEQGLGTLAQTLPIKVSKGQRIAEFCWMSDNQAGLANVAGLIAIRVDTSAKGVVAIGHPVA